MKKINSIVSLLKLIVKYGLYVMVIVDILQYSIAKFTELDEPAEPEKAIEDDTK